MQENLIKATCKDLEITQKELAELMQVSEVSISNWAKDGNYPKWAVRMIDLLKKERDFNKLLKNFNEIADYIK